MPYGSGGANKLTVKYIQALCCLAQEIQLSEFPFIPLGCVEEHRTHMHAKVLLILMTFLA